MNAGFGMESNSLTEEPVDSTDIESETASTTRVLIVSVGGSIEPLIKTISEHRPQFVCFFCSQPTVDLIGEIKAQLDVEIRNAISDHKVIVDDVNDILHCYHKACECIRKAVEWGGTEEDTAVDFTGGTKVMSVAIAIASVSRNFAFSYVGGTQRTKAGTGIVVSGSEEVSVSTSPWAMFAVEERRLAAELFNQYQFAAARKIALGKAENPYLNLGSRETLSVLADLSRAYELWDKFRHREAIEALGVSLKRLEEFVRFPLQHEFSGFIKSAKKNLSWLIKIQEETENFERQSRCMVTDLVSNAVRRSVEGKYDDAVARLYRAMEMFGQIAISDEPLLIKDAGNVPPERIPADIRDEFVEKFSQKGKIKISLFGLYRLLNSAGHPAGTAFFEHENRHMSLLERRNSSILAHGLKPISSASFETFLSMIQSFLELEDEIEFAKFPTG